MSDLNQIDILGNSSIGLFGIATDKLAIFPFNLKKRISELIKSTIQVPIITTSIVNCNLVGLFTAANTNHIILPNLISDLEYQTINQNLPEDVQIHILDTKITALGNAIVTSDKVTLIHPEFTKGEMKEIADVLDTEVVARNLLNNPLVGSLVFRNQYGLLTHPLMSDEELRWLSDFFGIPSDVVTVNRGTPFPRPGIIANSNGALVGSDTSGPELMRIYEILLSSAF